jgi:hypothetical protein
MMTRDAKPNRYANSTRVLPSSFTKSMQELQIIILFTLESVTRLTARGPRIISRDLCRQMHQKGFRGHEGASITFFL